MQALPDPDRATVLSLGDGNPLGRRGWGLESGHERLLRRAHDAPPPPHPKQPTEASIWSCADSCSGLGLGQGRCLGL